MSGFARYNPGEPLGPDNPFDATTTNRVRQAVEELQSEYTLPGGIGSEEEATLTWGIVESGTPAVYEVVTEDVTTEEENEAGELVEVTNEVTTETLTPGTINAWPIDDEGVVDKSEDPIPLKYFLTRDPVVGEPVGWRGEVVEEIGGAGGTVGCGLRIEVNTTGGLHYRILSDTCTGPWESLPATVCNAVPFNAPIQEPS